MIRVRQPEIDVGNRPPAQALYGVVFGFLNRLQFALELGESFLTDAAKKIPSVFEVKINRGGRILDLAGDGAHGDVLHAFLEEQLASRLENFLSQMLLLSLTPFFDSHDPPSLTPVSH